VLNENISYGESEGRGSRHYRGMQSLDFMDEISRLRNLNRTPTQKLINRVFADSSGVLSANEMRYRIRGKRAHSF